FGRAAAPDENIGIVVARDFKHDVIRRRSLLKQLRTVTINEVLMKARFRIRTNTGGFSRAETETDGQRRLT
ncbi:MAG: hypothetical protein WBD90_18445, partial [Xanthobacteraceae bacterium]